MPAWPALQASSYEPNNGKQYKCGLSPFIQSKLIKDSPLPKFHCILKTLVLLQSHFLHNCSFNFMLCNQYNFVLCSTINWPACMQYLPSRLHTMYVPIIIRRQLLPAPWSPVLTCLQMWCNSSHSSSPSSSKQLINQHAPHLQSIPVFQVSTIDW